MQTVDDHAALRAQVVEQAMRVSAHEALVAPWLTVGPRSPQARVALGRLLAVDPFPLEVTSPVAIWVGGHLLNAALVAADWRDRVPARPGSLYDELTQLELTRPHACGPDPCLCCPMARLHDAREATTGR